MYQRYEMKIVGFYEIDVFADGGFGSLPDGGDDDDYPSGGGDN